MIVDAQADRAQTLRDLLGRLQCGVVGVISSTAHLPAEVRRLNPDLILIVIDMPERETLEEIGALSQELPRAIAMFTRQADPKVIRAAVAAGVCAYVCGGLEPARVRSEMQVAMAHFEQYQQMRREIDKARTALTDRICIDRAKGVLMAQARLTESQAYAKLRTLAMNQNRRIADVAQQIIDMAELLRPPTIDPPNPE